MAREEILPQLNPSRKGRIGKYPTSECNTTKNEVSFKLKRLSPPPPFKKKNRKTRNTHDTLIDWINFTNEKDFLKEEVNQRLLKKRRNIYFTSSADIEFFLFLLALFYLRSLTGCLRG